jgi:hypothetical protein
MTCKMNCKMICKICNNFFPEEGLMVCEMKTKIYKGKEIIKKNIKTFRICPTCVYTNLK